MTIEIVDGDRYEHWQFEMAINRKRIFQFLKPLLKSACGLVYTLLADTLDVKFIIALHADLLDFAFGPTLPHFLLGELIGLSESGQLFLGRNASPILQLADVARRKAEPVCQLFNSPIFRFPF